MTVLIGMCLLGLFIALGTWVLSWSDHVQKELQVKVYFCTSVVRARLRHGATQAQEQAVGAALPGRPRVKHVIFVSKEQAQKQMQKTDPGALQGASLPSNPLPDA